MGDDVIKSFLVGLGFGVDDASYTKFTKAIASATLKVSALYGSIQATTSAVAYGITKISESFEQLGYEYKIIAPAINKALMLRKEMLHAYAAAGVNLTKVVQESLKFNLSVTKTKYAFEALYKSVASRFFPLLTKQSDMFRQRLYANMPKIQAGLERFITFLFKAFEATVQLGERIFSILSRVYDFFLSLHRATDGWSTIILGLVAAWQLLNLSFIAANPILSLVLAGLLAILALYDDFKVWQEGGKSFFDWSDALPIINGVAGALSIVVNFLNMIGDLLANVVLLLAKLRVGMRIGDVFSQFGHDVKADWNRFWDHPNTAANIGGPKSGVPSVSPLGAGAHNNQTNQNVQLQTSVTVHGVADAEGAGKATRSATDRSNFDFVRNLKGATTP